MFKFLHFWILDKAFFYWEYLYEYLQKTAVMQQKYSAACYGE